MADPLSVSASISGLITLADIVFRRTYKYVKAVKKAPKEISALSAEIGALYGILSNLQLVSRQLEDETFESTTRVHHIHSCYQTLEHVKSILDRDDTSSLGGQRLETLKRKLRWPFTSSEVKDLITEIERHKTTLGLALNVDCMSGLLKALSRQDQFLDTIEGMRTELKERHEAETRIAINNERQEILKSFAKVDSRSNHDMSRKLRSPGTGLWLTEGQEFRQWWETKNGRLWFYGIPGAGKTVLASSVIEEALRMSSPSIAVAFFYCDYKDSAKQDLSNILGSLAQQFAKQDEESFAKLRQFYETHNPEHQQHFAYDSDHLWGLVRKMTLVFDCAMIIVDGLDECGTNAPLVVDALTALNDGEDTTIKTIFLSRDEIEIRERLENYTKVSIAARSNDLRLYVGAEIDLRTRKRRLRIKDQSLKEHILERLVEGAEGMFRWVTCQMDYLCELPNDAARRVALGSLPPDLTSTYERILNRVNQSNPETQKLVRRTLRWITNGNRITTEAVCEAVSIDLGSTRRNSQAIPDVFEILHWCSSLVRKSADGSTLELAHFTVQEFLQQIDPRRDISFGAYRIDPESDKLILTEVCLTYLNFEDFDQGGQFGEDVVERRHECPFRRYASEGWYHVARKNMDDPELFRLLQKLFSPSKPNTLVSWMRDMAEEYLEDESQYNDLPMRFSSILAEVTTLHYAAMHALTKLCSWLIRSGCDVNRNTSFGTPLHFAILSSETWCWRLKQLNREPGGFVDDTSGDTVDLLLECGADPNCCYDLDDEKRSPLFMALIFGRWHLAERLLDRGVLLDSGCLDILENHARSEDICKLVEHTSNDNVLRENHSRLLQLALRAKTSSNATRLIHEDDDLPCQNTHYEHVLRTAAEFGQVEIVTRLLDNQKLDVDAADEGTGFTALHHAARTDQLEVAQVLMDRGANSSRPDSLGRTALHHSVQGKEVRCLQFLLQQDADTSLRDLEGMTVGHLAAQGGNAQALSILLSMPVVSALTTGIEANDGRTAFLCASANGSKEAMSLLLRAGSSLTETTSDGCSALHYAAKSGSLEGVKFLTGQTIDPCAVTLDESNALHYAISGNSETLPEIVHVLLEYGVDPHKARNDGFTPLHDLVRIIRDNSLSSDQLDHLFTASRTLLRKLLGNPRLASDLRLGSELIYLACTHPFNSANEIVLGLLELGLDCNIPSSNGRTALMAAAESGNDALLSTLLLHEADPCINDSGLNAVHCACFNDHKNILVQLRETGIDWNSKTTATIMGSRRKNVTALHIAAQFKDSSVLEYLLNEDLMSNIDACTHRGETPLSVAVRARASRNVSLLLSNKADASVVDASGNSAIHRAAKWGNEEVIVEFIGHGSDLGLANSLGLDPELVARKYGHESLAKIIMDYVHEQNEEPNTHTDSQRPGKTHGASEALKIAVDIGDLKLCTRLVENGADLRSGFKWCMGCTPLLYSLHKDQHAISEYLVSQGAPTAGSTCEFFPTRGFTAFHYAAARGSVQLLRLLLEKAPSEMYANHDPIHFLHYAVLENNTECVKLMLEHASQGEGRTTRDGLGTLQENLGRMVNMQVQGDMLRWSWYAEPSESFPESLLTAKPLHIAASEGNSDVVLMLLDYGASIDCVDGEYATPLHHAASNGQTAMVKLLLDSGANPNAVDLTLESPCMAAAFNDQLDSIRALLQGSADIQLRNSYGQNALHLAAGSGSKNVLVFLLNTPTGHNLGAKDTLGISFFDQAMSRRSSFPMTLLLNLALPVEAYESRTCNILSTAVAHHSATDVRQLLRRLPTGLLPRLLNHPDLFGTTPLYTAAVLAKIDTINLLLDVGAQLETEGSEYGTTLMGACATGRLAAVRLLVARGAKTSYEKDGQCYSALLAAKHHPEVRRWLLVGRFLEGPKLLTYKEVEWRS
ncbi:hypothetical protein HO133_000605 [Letharia lupina]|uniref:Ankyrin repeat protein n=1 Tax=Letharia lupina TaxID=560253 RepID=A0A8H6FBS8_9LECA|nr:uncharacterized protein HO133_000605 [Letharia lupina]KAF6222560.1 hypothetical protein HO133_000605 [Letharia lupina]